jgi:hypothetical protein
MPHIKTSPDHPASMAERVSKRLQPSCDTKNADEYVVKGTGPTRTASAIHFGAGHTPVRNVRGKNIQETAKQRAPKP